jgi:uncharacterized protein (DUF1800 family)
MLLASAKHPAMLKYLNLGESTKKAVNENYGRELLELHTVGLRYSEADVVNASKLLTGRTLDAHDHYVYDDYIHPTGAVTVLGFTNANTDPTLGEAAGDALIRYLAKHPYTARRLAQKLCVRLVSDTPSSALVTAVAKAYTDNNTQILPMVSTILRSTEFWSSRGAKVRRPAENLIATIRVLGIGVSDYGKALQMLDWMTSAVGNRPMDWPTPDGYADVATAWRSASTLMNLWDAHLALTAGWWQGLKAATPSALYGTPATSGEAITNLTLRLTGSPWSTAHLAALQSFVGEAASTPMSRSKLQWLTESLVAVILDGPHHALR